jgi:proteic killer suppression protein
VIESFASKETEKIFLGEVSKKLPMNIQRTAVPGNRFEKTHGDRAGQFSIRINDQWRICFEWKTNKARNVEIVDYHA